MTIANHHLVTERLPESGPPRRSQMHGTAPARGCFGSSGSARAPIVRKSAPTVQSARRKVQGARCKAQGARRKVQEKARPVRNRAGCDRIRCPSGSHQVALSSMLRQLPVFPTAAENCGPPREWPAAESVTATFFIRKNVERMSCSGHRNFFPPDGAAGHPRHDGRGRPQTHGTRAGGRFWSLPAAANRTVRSQVELEIGCLKLGTGHTLDQD